MTVLAKIFKRHLPKLRILLLLLSFGIMTGFSTVLHAHELDFSSTHDDCAPCHWSQSKEFDETNASGVDKPSLFKSFQLIPTKGINKLFINKLFNRGPPLFS